tara:strand:+ start:458850 stop:459704 length:855 start_codon:yes stop_codon:yes gene_type:complete
MELFGYAFKLNSFLNILLYTLAVLAITWIVSKFTRFLLVKYIGRKNKDDPYSITRLKFAKNSVIFLSYIVAFFVLVFTIPAFRSKATLIFSGAGLLAAIIGFAAQAAVSNLIAGGFIVIFKPFRVGDFIRLDDFRLGIVQDITLRHTVINTFENKRLIIPNSLISTESIFNHTIEDMYVLSFNNFIIGLQADIDRACEIITEEALKLPNTIDNRTPEEVLNGTEQVRIRVREINEVGIYLRALIWVPDPYEEFILKSNLLRAVHKRFRAEGVELPVPLRRIVEN